MRLLLLLGLVAGCGNKTVGPYPDLSSRFDQALPPADLAGAPDQSSPSDLAATDDLATPVDLSMSSVDGPACMADKDCRLFSSYCADAPCVCFVLGPNDKDPVCMGGMVTCLIDPCMKFSASCVNNVCVKK